jgi:hypothetical protein
MPVFIEIIDSQDNAPIILKAADIQSIKSIKEGAYTEIRFFVGATVTSSTPYTAVQRLFEPNAIKRVPAERKV